MLLILINIKNNNMAVPKKKVSRNKRDVRRNNKKQNLPIIFFNVRIKKYHLRHHFTNINIVKY